MSQHFTYSLTDESGTLTGQAVTIERGHLLALGYPELQNQTLGRPVTLPLTWKDSKVVRSAVPGIPVGARIDANSTLQSTLSTNAIGLVKGGWLPSGLALQEGMVVLPDRCTLCEIKGRFNDGAELPNRSPDFLSLLADQAVQINPLLYALEGNTRTPPTPDAMRAQWLEACSIIRSALPLADIIPKDGDGVSGVIGIASDTQEGMAAKQAFLMHLAPQLSAPVSARKRPCRWEQILAEADRFRVPKRSLVVLAALSSVAVANGRSPARRLLKWTDRYCEKDAYNAAADLRALEVMMALFALFPAQQLMLCTGDKDLALFWTGIDAHAFGYSPKGIEFTVRYSEYLFPDIPDEWLRMI